LHANWTSHHRHLTNESIRHERTTMSDPPTPDRRDIARLIAGYLDDCLSDDEATQLGRLVASEPDTARELARAAMLHDRLRDLFREESVIGETPAAVDGPDGFQPLQPLQRPRRWLVALLAVAAVVTLAFFFQPRSGGGIAAAAALDRLVAAATSPIDREYRIDVLDHGPDGPPPTVMSAGKGRKPGINGASLFVRGIDRFVLVRRFGDGTEFLTGCDGTIGWAVPPKGRVHLSEDARRFRRGVPGEHEELPFVDLRSGFEGLRRGYDLSLVPEANGQQLLEARRRARRQRGPDTVRVWFDQAGVATRIEIEGLPVEDNMPRSVAMTLVSQQDRGERFYAHETHHPAERPVSWE
jgi:hypothetical protein